MSHRIIRKKANMLSRSNNGHIVDRHQRKFTGYPGLDALIRKYGGGGNQLFSHTIQCSQACANPQGPGEGPPSGGQYGDCMGACNDAFGCGEGVNNCV